MSAYDIVNFYKNNAKGTADVYGVVVYTNRHASIRKVLNDKEYWEAFDEVSGDRFVVFAVKSSPANSSTPSAAFANISTSNNIDLTTKFPMIDVSPQYTSTTDMISELGLDDSIKLPALIIFKKFEHQERPKCISIRLDDTSLDNAYQSIRVGIKVVSTALNNMDVSNLQSKEGGYAGVHMAVSSHNEIEFIKKMIEKYLLLKGLKP